MELASEEAIKSGYKTGFIHFIKLIVKSGICYHKKFADPLIYALEKHHYKVAQYLIDNDSVVSSDAFTTAKRILAEGSSKMQMLLYKNRLKFNYGVQESLLDSIKSK
ncbi:hypothetical protein AYI69_g9145 [Smittium culicis]|uniref:Ankyrin repeat protein n=1 Tax=Smittium culicis TaxID=133412 RepID=A0A1R1XEN3_9FUNG|nr:hypothetical protein AYI69_g9145 [Smittium culicis]